MPPVETLPAGASEPAAARLGSVPTATASTAPGSL
jgi:hypothetical protein